MDVKVSYVSASCNQTPSIADWGFNNQICYGSSNAVLIYDLYDTGRVIFTLVGHKKRVNAVRWIKGNTFETELVSVSTDNDVVVWTLKDGEFTHKTLKGHTGIVNVVDALYKKPKKEDTIIATSGADSTINIWFRKTELDDFVLQQNISLGYNICLSLRLTVLPKSDNLIMACATDNSIIDIYLEDSGKLEKKSNLKGHEDWVRGLDFVTQDNGNVLLASSSQDGFIRLWKFTSERNLTETESKLTNLNEIETPLGKFKIHLESILSGHEGWVYSVSWSICGQKLLSSSLDKTIIVWEFNPEAKLWLETARVGEIGGNTLGFYGATFNGDGSGILGHGYHGALHIWLFNEEEVWQPQVTVGGHFSEVVDMSWDPLGKYLMTVSYDQTTRVHAPWIREEDERISWHEIARPQVHGYDLSCLAMLGHYKFASGAEEKIIRIFEAPDNFVQNFKRICKIEDEEAEYNAPKGASVPSLGLSNKAVFENDNSEQAMAKSSKEPYPEESHFTAITLNEPPFEETLMQNTLWPEISKLYGHGYELYSLASSPDGKLLASACKATTAEHAALLLWETENFQIIQKLASHTLTVAQIAFSPDSNNILSVSRDRRWSLFTKNPQTNKFELSATTDKATGIHARIIWTCAWTHDSQYFATGSRDGKVVVWRKNADKSKENCLGQYEVASNILGLKGDSVTALAFAPDKVNGKYLLAVGLESGNVILYQWNSEGFKEIVMLDNMSAHHLTVKRLAFRPMFGLTGLPLDEGYLQLASCSSDYSVRIYNISLPTK